MKKKDWFRSIIIGLIIVAGVIYCFTHIKFQSRDSFEKEREELIAQMESEPVLDADDEKGNNQEKAGVRKEIPEKAEEKNNTENNTEVKKEAPEKTGEKKNNQEETGVQKEVPENFVEKENNQKETGEKKEESEKAGEKENNQKETGVKKEVPEKAGEKNNNQDKTDVKKKESEKNPDKNKESGSKKEEKIEVTLSISCENLMDDTDRLSNPKLLSYLPDDGNILPPVSFKIEKGSSAYDALKIICMKNDIQMESDFTPIYNTYYVRGIGYLYEKDAGQKSGWLYKVNQESSDRGSSSYILEDGDEIQWVYTLNGGKDI